MTALIWAALKGHSDNVKVLLEAGAAIEAKDDVSKRISICTCVCVCYILPSLCMICRKCCFILFLYFIIVICRI